MKLKALVLLQSLVLALLAVTPAFANRDGAWA
jgi:hypothetical protein